MQGLTMEALREAFPFTEMRPAQIAACQEVVSAQSGLVLEMATGEGKTAFGLAVLKAVSQRRNLPVVFTVPTKALVEQICTRHPNDTAPVYGRSEFECLYYTARGEEVNAQDSPCYMLQCPHRLDMGTGQTVEDGAEPCPYYLQKYRALEASKTGKVIVATWAFFILSRLKTNWRDMEFGAVVADEGHRLADMTRRLFEYTFTDYHLGRLYAAMMEIEELHEQAVIIRNFLRVFRRICRRHPSQTDRLLTEDQIRQLIEILDGLDDRLIEREIRRAQRAGVNCGRFGDREMLALLQNLVFNVRALVNGLRRSVSQDEEEGGRPPLNYVVAFYRTDEEQKSEANKRKRVQYRLSIRSYYVAPLIRLALGDHPVVMSATVGDDRAFNWENGLRRLRFTRIPCNFPVGHTRMYVPTDVAELSIGKLGDKQYRRIVKQSMRLVLKHALTFARNGHRSLIVVISEDERQKMVALAAEEFGDLDMRTYDGTVTARELATRFRRGEGQVLLGTAGQYAEGIDLPAETAPVIFFFKPGYPNPEDPQAMFEQRRYGGAVHALWQWRVMIRAMQVRGRNIRSEDDLGVCFFVDRRFARIVRPAAPEWLQPAYRGQMTFEAGVQDALNLLG